MFRLKTAYTGFLFTNLLALLTLVAAYFYRPKKRAIFACAILIPVLIYIFGIDPVNSGLVALIFGLIMAGSALCREDIESEDRDLRLEVDKEGANRHKLSDKLAELEGDEREIKEGELMILNLYEITKKMSANLRFNDIFNVFSAFLKTNFTFRKCDLLILNWEDALLPRLERIYSVWQESGDEATKQFANYDKLIKVFLENPQNIYASRDTDAKLLAALGVEDPLIHTYTAIPLISEKKLVAILGLENLERDDLEKFLILSMQFALEIKKVLLYEMVEKLAITDSLTGLYLRRYFYDRLNEELQRSRRHKSEFGFLMLDIDDFKRANDMYGHLVGDVILKDIGHLIKDSVREIDLVSRYGGEEFALILPDTNPEGAVVVAERIRKRIEEHVFKAYDEQLKITISAGMSAYPKDSVDADDLIEKADAALYEAKKMGKNVVCRYKK